MVLTLTTTENKCSARENTFGGHGVICYDKHMRICYIPQDIPDKATTSAFSDNITVNKTLVMSTFYYKQKLATVAPPLI